MCVDYKQLNQLQSKMPIHYRESMRFSHLCTTHTAFGVVSADWLSTDSRPRGVSPENAFTTQKGNYFFNMMPFGLCNAPATFQRLMDGIFPEQIRKDLAAQLDDLLMSPLRHEEMLPFLGRIWANHR